MLLGLALLIGAIIALCKIGFWIGYDLVYLIAALIFIAIIYGILKH